MTATNEHNNENRRIHYDNFVVLWIDILGTGQQFEKHLTQPGQQISREHADQIKSATAKIIGIRGALNDMVSGPVPFFVYPADAQNKVSREFYDKMVKSNKIRTQVLSDTIVLYCPLSWGQMLPNTYPVAFFAAVAARVMMSCLMANTPIRGSMTISTGCEVDGVHELFGHAMVCAHHIESKVAKWPRVVVDERFMSILDSASHDVSANDNVDVQTVARVAMQASKLIRGDGCNTYMIDWFSKHALDTYENIDKHEVNSKVRSCIHEQLRLAKGNKEIESKYLKLLEYVNESCRRLGLLTRG